MNELLLELKKREVHMEISPNKYTNGLLIIFTKSIHYKAYIIDFESLADVNNDLLPIIYGYFVDFINYVYEKESKKGENN